MDINDIRKRDGNNSTTSSSSWATTDSSDTSLQLEYFSTSSPSYKSSTSTQSQSRASSTAAATAVTAASSTFSFKPMPPLSSFPKITRHSTLAELNAASDFVTQTFFPTSHEVIANLPKMLDEFKRAALAAGCSRGFGNIGVDLKRGFIAESATSAASSSNNASGCQMLADRAYSAASSSSSSMCLVTAATLPQQSSSRLSTTRTVSSSSLSSNSNQDVNKRKRKFSKNDAEQDAGEVDMEPTAKRQQRLPSLTSSSTGLPSPPDDLDDNIQAGYDSDDSASQLPSIVSTRIVFTSSQSDILAAAEEDTEHEADYSCEYSDTEEEEEEVQNVVESNKKQSTKIIEETKVTETAAAAVAEEREESTIKEKKAQLFDDYMPYSCIMTPATDYEQPRQCPLPALSWANAHEVWQLMCKKDQDAAALRSGDMMLQHTSLQPRMRAILLDWLIEVCEVYKLHRETYYLALDYIDRYLFAQKQLPKTMLQLLGITCLFIAAKVEEIYPPKIGEFAYVTDGACQEADILQQEIMVLQVLNWNISPVTPMGWLGVYMQLNVNNRTPRSFYVDAAADLKKEYDESFIYPQFSGLKFVQTAQLLDLCSLDVGIGNYSYSVLAAAAMSHVFNRETAMRCSGLEWSSIADCASWLKPFYQVTRKELANICLQEMNEQVPNTYGLAHICPNIVTDEAHIIQMHTINLDMFSNACELRMNAEQNVCVEDSPATVLMCPEVLLTPPASSSKIPDINSNDREEPACNVIMVDTVKVKKLKKNASKNRQSCGSSSKETRNPTT